MLENSNIANSSCRFSNTLLIVNLLRHLGIIINNVKASGGGFKDIFKIVPEPKY